MKKVLLLAFICIAGTTAMAQDTLKVDVPPSYKEMAIQIYNQGVEQYNAKKYNEAIDYSKNAIKHDPRMTDAYLLMASAQRAIYDYKGAEASLNSYLETGLHPGRDTIYYILAQIYKETTRQKDEVTALTNCLNENPKFGDAYYKRGSIRFSSGDYEGALSDMTNAIDNGIDKPEIYNDRGSTYRQLGRFELALADYSKAIEMSPKAMYYCNRASIYTKIEEPEKAINDYTQAIIRDSKYYKAYNGRGVVNANLHNYQEAIDDFTVCLSHEPTYTSALSNRGIAYYHMGQYAKAVSDLDAAIALEPHNGNTYMYRGNVKEMMRDAKGATEDWIKASSLGVKTADRYFTDQCR
ncbi:MAG: tetratricopeptide repeat protein [Bacteroidales bacterium]|nr:tetratricopeptide repeat protein [Bacteroidales bacterium]